DFYTSSGRVTTLSENRKSTVSSCKNIRRLGFLDGNTCERNVSACEWDFVDTRRVGNDTSPGGRERRAVMHIEGIDHVQLAIPAGQEDAARRFYSGLLEIPEVPKPPDLAKRGGAWFEWARQDSCRY